MLDNTMKAQLKTYLERVVRPIVITAFVDDGAKSKETLELLADIAPLSDKITVVESRDTPGARIPSFALTSPGQNIHLVFAGLPWATEFTSLVLALLQTGGYPPKVEQAIIDQIKGLDGGLHLRDLLLPVLPELPRTWCRPSTSWPC